VKLSKSNLDDMAEHRRDRFYDRLAVYLRQNVPQAKAMTPEALVAHARKESDVARQHGFKSEQALAFWSEVSLREGSGVWFDAAVQPALNDREGADVDRIKRAVDALEAV